MTEILLSFLSSLPTSGLIDRLRAESSHTRHYPPWLLICVIPDRQ